jgi:predicted dehydrogenase
MKLPEITRREFVRLGTGAAALAGADAAKASAAIKSTLLKAPVLSARTLASGRKIRFVSIGTGIRGCDLLRAAKQVPTGVCVGAADLYDMRHKAAQEVYGAEFSTTRDYRELLDRKDVDAVIIATPDHQHKRVTLDAIAAGKDVYCEKPMSHTVADGFAMVDAVESNKRIFQAGSQRVSSILYAKAREIYASGRLGEVHEIDAKWNRNTPGGAWVYPIPPDAGTANIDWDAFLRDAPQRPFDPVRFFRWRCFTDYGEGLGGDLFVHLISGIQVITGIDTVASRAYSSGGLYRYKDGRDFPDFIETTYDYPDAPNGGLQVHLHCNQNNDDGDEALSFFGSAGTLVVTGRSVTFTPQDTAPRFDAYGWSGMTEAQRKQGSEEWHAAHPQPPPALVRAATESYVLPQGYNDTADHIANFFRAIETREQVVENQVFGNHAAIGCHLANYSYFHRSIATWDAAAKTIRG